MGMLDRIEARLEARLQRSWPVGNGALGYVDATRGHQDERFSPDEYGDYLATSNDVFAVVNLRAKKMGALRPLLFDVDGPERTAITTGRVVELFEQPNEFWTMARLNRMDELCSCLWGQSFWAIQSDTAGQPNEFWWMKPTRVRVVPDANGYVKGFLYQPADGGEPIPFRADEVFWQRYPNPINEFSPLAPLAAARLAADTSAAMMRSNRLLFENGMQPGGIITPKDGAAGSTVTFSVDQANELRDKLEERLKGVKNAHRWAVMRFDAQVKELSISPKDAEFIAGLNISLRAVCRAYGVPSPLMMDLEHATLANVKEFDRMLWDHALVPDADFKAADLRLQVLPRFAGPPSHLEWDYSKVPVLQESLTSVWDREKGQLETGAQTINEWRKAKGLPPVPWGDVWWAPVNKAQVADEATVVPPPNGDPAPVNADPGGATDRALARLLDAVPARNGHH
jgi:HK97 family phage portal protein